MYLQHTTNGSEKVRDILKKGILRRKKLPAPRDTRESSAYGNPDLVHFFAVLNVEEGRKQHWGKIAGYGDGNCFQFYLNPQFVRENARYFKAFSTGSREEEFKDYLRQNRIEELSLKKAGKTAPLDLQVVSLKDIPVDGIESLVLPTSITPDFKRQLSVPSHITVYQEIVQYRENSQGARVFAGSRLQQI